MAARFTGDISHITNPKSLRAINRTQKIIDRQVNFAKLSGAAATVARISEQQLFLQKAISGLPTSTIDQLSHGLMDTQMASLQLANSLMRNSGYLDMVQSLSETQKLWSQYAAINFDTSAYSDLIQTMTRHQSAWSNMVENLFPQSTLINFTQALTQHQNAFDRIARGLSNQGWIEQLAQPNVYSELIKSFDLREIPEDDFDDFDDFDEELSEAAEIIESIEDEGSFLQYFSSVSMRVQKAIIFLLTKTLPDVLTTLCVLYLIVPAIEEYRENNSKPKNEQIKDIKKIPSSVCDIDISDCRLITGDNVRLRSEASRKSIILHELFVGDLVTVLLKKKNWIKVSFIDEEGVEHTGWVFTRYTAKFGK